MKKGDVGIAHGANWFGVVQVTKVALSKPGELVFSLAQKPDHWEYWEYYEPDDGKPIGSHIFEECFEAGSEEAAWQIFAAIKNRRHPLPEQNCRHPLPETVRIASPEAVRVREAELAKTDFGKVLEAIKANDPVRAAKVYADIATALSNEPHEDDKASVVRLRKLFKQRQTGHRSWHLLLVANWDELQSLQYGEISQWLERNGERGITTDAVAKFMQLIRKSV